MKKAKNALLDKIDEEISLAAESGTVNAPMIATTVFHKYPDLVDEYAEQAVLSWLRDITGRKVKKWGDIATADRILQPNLPGMDPDLISDIPAAVFIPGEKTEDGEKEGSYRMLTGNNRAKHWEVRIAIEFLWKGINADTKKARALEELVSLSKSQGRGDDDPVL